MKKSVFLMICIVYSLSAFTQWTPAQTEWYYPVPEKVTPGKMAGSAPSDAILLFDGTDLSKWVHVKGDAPQWNVSDGVMSVKPGTGGIMTKDHFGDCQLHIEFRSPDPENHSGQNRGNSGIFQIGRALV